MCPQGLCKAGDYILISAYDPYEIYNSCIHVVEEATGEYIKTVWLKDNNYHAGGITSEKVQRLPASSVPFCFQRPSVTEALSSGLLSRP